VWVGGGRGDLEGDGVDAAEERVLLRRALAMQDLDHLLARQGPLQLLPVEELLLQLLKRLQANLSPTRQPRSKQNLSRA
jgi:hypothetical protein